MANLNFDLFKETIVEGIKEYLGSGFIDAEVELKEVLKNNDQLLTGLTLRRRDRNICPTLYLEPYFEAYEDGKDIEEIMEKIATIYAEADADSEGLLEQVQDFSDYEKSKDKVLPRLVNKKRNEERLKDLPYVTVSDLAIIYFIDMGNDESGQMSVVIRNDLMDRWEINVEDLNKLAFENLEKRGDAEFKTMVETLAGLMIPNYDEMSEEEKEEAREQLDMPDPGMYVLSNSAKTFGATAVLRESTMEEIISKLGEDFYILPSSIHEVLIVPNREGMEVSELKAMVEEVNATQVAPEEVLSDNVYRYNSETKSIEIAS